MKNGLGKSLVDKGRLSKWSVPTKEYYRCPREDKMEIYKPKYQMDKQLKLAILYSGSKQEYKPASKC